MASVDEPLSAEEPVLVGGSPNQDASSWESWPGGTAMARVRHREIQITNLQPRQRYNLQLLFEGQSVAQADVTTLPTEMPTDQKPFTVLLGTCFSHHQDPGGNVGKTFAALPTIARPDVKLLAGDQVYLDEPWYKFASNFNREELHASFLDAYAGTWGQGRGFGSGQGFAQLLSSGANYFSSDDHEFWNNAPSFVAFARNTWTQSGRDEWWKAASSLYRTFQMKKPLTRFDVQPVSFLIVDTRVNRDDSRTNFLSPSTEAEVETWVAGLKGPGVMVVGQPILQTVRGWIKGTFTDWNLPDFEQYDNLVHILAKSQQSIIILTGDVHFGRIARARLPSGKELIEIISSPMALVHESARGTWAEAPDRFPSKAGTGLARSDVSTEQRLKATDAHFLTLEFTRRGPGVNLRLRYWPILLGASAPSNDFGMAVWERQIN